MTGFYMKHNTRLKWVNVSFQHILHLFLVFVLLTILFFYIVYFDTVRTVKYLLGYSWVNVVIFNIEIFHIVRPVQNNLVQLHIYDRTEDHTAL